MLINRLMNRVQHLLHDGIADDADRELLANSLFYYCSGKDPTPMAAFGAQYPLYIYADMLVFGDDFETETGVLMERMKKAGFSLREGRRFTLRNGIPVLLVLWKTAQMQTFVMAFVQGDAEEVFRRIYADGSRNYIQPRCICNCRYEFTGGLGHQEAFFSLIAKRTEYILGSCYSEKYKRVGEVRYLGDYGDRAKVPLHRRMYWYVY